MSIGWGGNAVIVFMASLRSVWFATWKTNYTTTYPMKFKYTSRLSPKILIGDDNYVHM